MGFLCKDEGKEDRDPEISPRGTATWREGEKKSEIRKCGKERRRRPGQRGELERLPSNAQTQKLGKGLWLVSEEVTSGGCRDNLSTEPVASRERRLKQSVPEEMQAGHAAKYNCHSQAQSGLRLRVGRDTGQQRTQRNTSATDVRARLP